MTTTPEDLEIAALGKVRQALEPLEPEAQGRVIEWASKRFSVQLSVPVEDEGGTGGDGNPPRRPEDFQTLGELFAAAGPRTDPERALVGAFWEQVHKGKQSFESQPVNTELKQLGYGVGNITDAIDSLKNRKPALVIQLQKRGTSKQARKSFKVTDQGINTIKKMVAEDADSKS